MAECYGSEVVPPMLANFSFIELQMIADLLSELQASAIMLNILLHRMLGVVAGNGIAVLQIKRRKTLFCYSHLSVLLVLLCPFSLSFFVHSPHPSLSVLFML